jgi:replication factor A1
MRSKRSPSEYLAFLCTKYKVDPETFFRALVSASKNHMSTCNGLSIKRRRTQRENVVLLITNGSKVVAQFPLTNEFLFEQKNSIKDIAETVAFNRSIVRNDPSPRWKQIKDLRIGMKSVDLKAEVVEIAQPKFVVTRFGNHASVANALISDETGKVKMCLWNDQIKSISEGDLIQIENATISAFRGEKQVRIRKNSLLTHRKMVTSEEARIVG